MSLLVFLLACAGDKGLDPDPRPERGDSAPPWEGPNDIAPGRYATSLIWVEEGRRCVRLAQMAFEEEGRISGLSWTFCQDLWGGLAEVQTVGTSTQDAPNDDAESAVVSLDSFVSGAYETLDGTWGHGDTSAEVELRWPDGATERWRRTWQDATLMKLEPWRVSRADAPEQTWLRRAEDGTFSRGADPVVAGFAFGGPAAPQHEEGALVDLSGLKAKNYTGRVCRWNGYYAAPDDVEGCFADGLSLASVFVTTSTGVERYAFPDAGMWVYAYLARVAGEGVLGRRLAYQISHDFDGDGNIMEGGHIYPGLVILDDFGEQRGVVYIDQSYDTGVEAVMIMSAMAYLDDGSDAAQEGIE